MAQFLENLYDKLIVGLKERDLMVFSQQFATLLGEVLSYKGAIKLKLNAQGEMVKVASFGLSSDYDVWNAKIGEERINEKVVISGGYDEIADLYTHPLTSPFKEIYQREGIRAFLALPITTPWGRIGVLNLYKKEAGSFSNDLIDCLQKLTEYFGTIAYLLWECQEEKERKELLKQRCDELQNLRNFYELIIDNIPIGVVATNKKGYVVLMNQVLEKMSKQKRQHVLGRKWYEVFGFYGETRKKLEKTYWTGKTNYFPEIHLGLVDGEVIPVEMKTAVIKNETEDVVGVVAICSDLSEKKKLEKEIERIEKLSVLGQIATGVAHEIRNPLAGISGALQRLKRTLTDSQSQYILEKVFDEIDRLNGVLENLFSFSSSQQLSFNEHKIEDICRDVFLFIQKPLLSHKITLIKKFDRDVPVVYVDKASMKQVLLNLFLNAIKAMPEGGKLTIETTLIEDVNELPKGVFWHKDQPGSSEKFDAPYVCIAVKDEGKGIPSSELPKIFEPFYSTSDGIGLGLYISSRIIEQHRGFMGVESEYGKGARFYILLPTEVKFI
ncbi:hypothetical protein DRN74_03980 [Candidatus Micrarchaeota archaeon]|nr:MAG: hypothetical protein DRN74_03980 [Candidatus Micrarchaeota archaeon]